MPSHPHPLRPLGPSVGLVRMTRVLRPRGVAAFRASMPCRWCSSCIAPCWARVSNGPLDSSMAFIAFENGDSRHALGNDGCLDAARQCRGTVVDRRWDSSLSALASLERHPVPSVLCGAMPRDAPRGSRAREVLMRDPCAGRLVVRPSLDSATRHAGRRGARSSPSRRAGRFVRVGTDRLLPSGRRGLNEVASSVVSASPRRWLRGRWRRVDLRARASVGRHSIARSEGLTVEDSRARPSRGVGASP